MTDPSLSIPRTVTLPRSSCRAAKPAFLKLLTRIGSETALWEGTIYRPGAVVKSEDLGAGPVVILECAGSLDKYRKGRYPEVLWVLWQWDWTDRRWHELARARAHGAEWAATLREPAKRAMYPQPVLIELMKRGREVSDEILRAIEARLESEAADTRALVLHEVYNQVAGKLAAA